jgi:HAMP domain-containing protein
MLKNLKIWQKLSLIVVAFSVPIGVLLHYLVTEQNIILDFARNELDGTQYLRPVRKLLADLCEHRTLAATVAAGGDAIARDKLQAKQAEVNADFAAVDQVEQRYAYKYKSEKALAAVKAYWEDVQKRSFASTPEVSYEQHRKLMSLVTNLIIVVGNDSELILDPDVDSYYAMDAVIFKIPAVVNQVSQMQAAALAGGRGNGEARRAQLAALQAVTEESLAAMQGNLGYGLAANSDMEARLKPLVGYVENSTRDFIEAVNSGSGFMAAGNKAIESSLTLYDSTMPMLDSLLHARIDNNAHRRTLSMAGAALAVVLSILLTVVIARSITRPVHRLSLAAERISMGEMGVEVEIRSRDEIGELSERFRRMQESLKVAMSQLGV